MSMKDIGIMDGDLLAVHKTQDVRNGQVVVARIDDEVTVKRLKNRVIRCSYCLKTVSFPQLWLTCVSTTSPLKVWRLALSAMVNGCNTLLSRGGMPAVTVACFPDKALTSFILLISLRFGSAYLFR
jgi:hypothetical protein